SIAVTLTSSNSQVGRAIEARTDVNGQYSIPDVPVGAVSLTAYGSLARANLFGQASGQVKSDGDSEAIDIQLVATLIPVGASGVILYDANNFPWDINQDASILSGLRRTFAGNFTTATHGLILQLSDSGGSVVPFAGEANA